jgi:hypothetical protein
MKSSVKPAVKTGAIPRVPLVLGAGGLLPFIALTIATVLWPASNPTLSGELLRGYAVVILTFVGAVHWGLAVAQPVTKSSTQLIWSVIPALFGWVALFIPLNWALWLLAAVFVIAAIIDRWAVHHGLAPAWYAELRLPLTTVVVVSLTISAFGLITRTGT